MADSFQDKRNKLLWLQAMCNHNSHFVFDTGEWSFEICAGCGLQQNVSHNCEMKWTNNDTTLICDVCGTDGT